MTPQSQSDAHVEMTGAETERAIRDFVRDVIARLNEVMKNQVQDWDVDTQWERGTDGHFRERTRRTQKLWPTLNDDWLQSQVGYGAIVACFKSDATVNSHLDRLVGTRVSASRLDANNILQSLVYAMMDAEGRLAFTDKQFDAKWRDFVGLFRADQ